MNFFKMEIYILRIIISTNIQLNYEQKKQPFIRLFFRENIVSITYLSSAYSKRT